MADEFERIAELKKRFASAAPQVQLGIGDDAAVLQTTERSALSVDCCVEGVHFLRDWLDMATLGERCVQTALSDLAAMGAQPTACLCALILPDDFADPDLYALADGLARAAGGAGAPVVGGNLARGGQLSVTTTVLGSAPEGALTRASARPGDAIFVTGRLGEAALGLALLQAERAPEGPQAVERWRRPRARLDEGARLVGRASAAIDISDGLLQDLEHLCRASGTGAALEADRLPLAGDHMGIAAALGRDGLALALSGGEDYELLFTMGSDQAPAGVVATRIGRIGQAADGVTVRDGAGQRLTFERHGFRHFSAR